MTKYQVGDYVLVRGKVLAVHGSDVGYTVEFFSKTDQYPAMIRPDLVIEKVKTPIPPEPDHYSALVSDRVGDIWQWGAGVDPGWKCDGSMSRDWRTLFEEWGPLTVYERSETFDAP